MNPDTVTTPRWVVYFFDFDPTCGRGGWVAPILVDGIGADGAVKAAARKVGLLFGSYTGVVLDANDQHLKSFSVKVRTVPTVSVSF